MTEINLVNQQDPAPLIQQPTRAAIAGLGLGPKSIDWRRDFHTVSELEQGEVRMLIESIMPEGVNFIGSLAGVGKTWAALSMARALSTGNPFLDVFKVPEPVPVLYLVPEMGSHAFRARCEKMGLPEGDMFRCRTLRDGLMRLTDPRLIAAVTEINPVVFLNSMSKPGNPDLCADSCTADCEREMDNCVYRVHLLFAASEALRHSDGQRPELLRRRRNIRRRTSTRVDAGQAMRE